MPSARTRGAPRPGRDIDLVVVVPDSQVSGYDRSRQAYALMDFVRLALGVLVWTRAELAAGGDSARGEVAVCSLAWYARGLPRSGRGGVNGDLLGSLENARRPTAWPRRWLTRADTW